MKIATGEEVDSVTFSLVEIWIAALGSPQVCFINWNFFRRDSLNWMSKDLTELISGKCRPGDLNGPFPPPAFDDVQTSSSGKAFLSLHWISTQTDKIRHLLVQSNCCFCACTEALAFFFPLSQNELVNFSPLHLGDLCKKMEAEWVNQCWEFPVAGVCLVRWGFKWLFYNNDCFFFLLCAAEGLSYNVSVGFGSMFILKYLGFLVAKLGT